METNVKRLQRQQMVLKFLGYYSGKCDGIWSAKTIAAKREFETSGKFAPAYPNNGAPFDFTSKLPQGLTLDWNAPRSGLIHHLDIPDGYYDQFKNELVFVEQTFDPSAIKAPVYDPLMNDTLNMQATPKPEAKVVASAQVTQVETTEVITAESKEKEVSQEGTDGGQPKVDGNTPNQQRQHQNHNKHNNRPR